jgi:hypothetical protein
MDEELACMILTRNETFAPLDDVAEATTAKRPSTPTSVVTCMIFPATPDQVWEELVLYEQIEKPPPLHLQLLLPVPIRTEGRKSEVGDEVKCLYEGGYLFKRVTRVVRGRTYAFEVIEQNLAVGGGIGLSGGGYTLCELPGGNTEVALQTRYVSPRRPRCLWKPIEAAVCHMFHGHILRAMRRNILSC